MTYDPSKIGISNLLRPTFDAGIVLTRLDERIARDVLRTRRRIAAQSPDWALWADGIRSLRKTAEITTVDTEEAQTIGARSCPMEWCSWIS